MIRLEGSICDIFLLLEDVFTLRIGWGRKKRCKMVSMPMVGPELLKQFSIYRKVGQLRLRKRAEKKEPRAPWQGEDRATAV